MKKYTAVYLSKKELRFIEESANIYDGVYDFENNPNKEFRQKYGLHKNEVSDIMESLKMKVTKGLQHLKQPT